MTFIRSIITKEDQASHAKLIARVNDTYDLLFAKRLTEHEALTAIATAMFEFVGLQPVQEEP